VACCDEGKGNMKELQREILKFEKVLKKGIIFFSG
jgi:hypothetical protein